jgi:hypothetical protein
MDNHRVRLREGDMRMAAMAETEWRTHVILMVRPVRAPIFSMQGNGYFGIVLMGMARLVRAGHKG